MKIYTMHYEQWCCEAQPVTDGVGVRPDKHPNAKGKRWGNYLYQGVLVYTCPSKNLLFMLINREKIAKEQIGVSLLSIIGE